MSDSLFGDIVSSYSRAEAIADGVLVDLSAIARQTPLRFPVAITNSAHESACVPTSATDLQIAQRAVIHSMLLAIAHPGSRQTDQIRFAVSVLAPDDTRREVSLTARIGPGDDPSPVITIMLDGED
ncbi:MAG: hypothetical protein PF961_07720 [Planctomycetota bacterium]|jgi:hypothetical protein|nr:hypothetical protein [Planctomycetota bacterium]